MLEIFSTYFVLLILLQLSVEIDCQMKPPPRSGHTATFIDGKLYILGGSFHVKGAEENVFRNDFFYLDVSVKFNTQNLFWQDLTSINTVPPHNGATSVKGGVDNNTLVLYGGRPFDAFGSVMTSLVYTFDTQSNSWTTPKITGVNTIKNPAYLKGIIDNNGKMYLWGGDNIIGKSVIYLNDMVILDTINFSWKKGSLIGAPTPRSVYSAVLLPDRKIIYMG